MICIVRAKSGPQAKQRVTNALVKYQLWSPAWWDTLHVEAGDFSKPLLGVSDSIYSEWCGSVSTVIHCGARVSLQSGYDSHRAANVIGTVEILRFSAATNARFVFISTTDTLLRTGDKEPYELPKEALDEHADLGYAISKVVGEALVVEAFSRGLDGVIVRLGMVGSDSQTGVSTGTDFVSRLYTGFAHTRSFPVVGPEHTMVSCLPVDVTATALCELALSSANHTAVNLVSGATPTPMSVIREWLLEFGGCFSQLAVTPFCEWMKLVEVDAALSLWPVFFKAAEKEEFPLFNSRKIAIGAALEHLSASTAQAITQGVDKQCLHKMLAYMYMRDWKSSVPAHFSSPNL